MPTLSVIVPVYNVEQYLDKCVSSLLRQDIADYEIILVDDGSTDASGGIADTWGERDARIKVIHQPNAGLGAARNTGIKAAEGEYVQFVDSDDYLEPAVLGALLARMRSENLDILRFRYQNVDGDGKVYEPYKEDSSCADYSEAVCNGAEFLETRLGFACYAVQFLIRRSLLDDCLFRTGMYFEDTEWAPRVLLKAGRVASNPVIAYNYLLRSGSITGATESGKKRKLLEDTLSLISRLKETSLLAPGNRWFGGMIARTAVSVLDYVSQDFWAERKSWLGRLGELKIFPLSLNCASPRKARKIRMANISPRLACWLLHIKNS